MNTAYAASTARPTHASRRVTSGILGRSPFASPGADRWPGFRSGGDPYGPIVHSTGRIPYRPDLDGLRAIAVGLVILDHAGLPTQAAQAGVTAFFVLSGYLITSILIREEKVD